MNTCANTHTAPHPFGFDLTCTLPAGHDGAHADTLTDRDARWEWATAEQEVAAYMATRTPRAMPTDALSTIIARIIAVHAAQGTPIDSFIDSRPADLSDLCADLGITLEQAIAAQAAMLAGE